jgi:hypothetical protein
MALVYGNGFSLFLGVVGLSGGERPRWLFLMTIAACALVFYACTFIDD